MASDLDNPTFARSPRTDEPLDRDSPRLLHRPLRLAPCFSERPWGGTRLHDMFGKATRSGKCIGESWELSDHSNGLSEMADGVFAGLTFGALMRRQPREMVGRPHAPERYPLLVKFIDAAENLSVQVHPDDSWCTRNAHADRGKSECWYILDCAENAEIVFGLQPGTGADEFREALANGTVEPLLRRVPIRRGSFVTVPPGTIHAILGGTLLCEIQQVSDTTFRLWDWNRKPERTLHLERGLEVSHFGIEPPPVRHLPPVSSRGVVERGLLANKHFRVRALDVPPNSNATVRIPSGTRTGWVVCVVAGGGAWRGYEPALNLGESWFLPACLAEPLDVRAGAEGLRLLMAESLEM